MEPVDRDQPAALVLGLSPTGLYVIRSLGRRGVPVHGADFSDWGVARFSRFCRYERELARISRQRDPGALCAALRSFASGFDRPPVLYVTDDEYIELLSDRVAELRDVFRLSTNLVDHGMQFVDKRRFYSLCKAHGVELSATHYAENVDEVRALAGEIRYPAIIKPARIHRMYKKLKGKKVLQAGNERELLSHYTSLAPADVVIQEVIPGPDDLIYVAACYFDEESRSKAIFVGRKLRQYPPRFGSACLAESLWQPEIARKSQDFLAAVRFSGICGTEYKWDTRDGKFKMIEINPRVTLWMGLTAAAGIDVAYAAYRDLVGLDVTAGQQVDGVRWRYLVRDVDSSLQYFAQGELSLGSWWRSEQNCQEDAILAKDDMAVTWYIPAYAVSRLLRRL